MNYLHIYNQLVYRGQQRWRSGEQVAGEWHHIVPRCMGGDNRNSNFVKLTYREHFIAHQLLARAAKQLGWRANLQLKLACGIKMMLRQRKGAKIYNSRSFATARAFTNRQAQLRTISESTKQKIAKALIGKQLPKARVAKVANANRGKKRSAEALANMSKAQKGKPKSAETKAKISASLKGKQSKNAKCLVNAILFTNKDGRQYIAPAGSTIRIIAMAIGISGSKITDLLRGKAKQTKCGWRIKELGYGQ